MSIFEHSFVPIVFVYSTYRLLYLPLKISLEVFKLAVKISIPRVKTRVDRF